MADRFCAATVCNVGPETIIRPVYYRLPVGRFGRRRVLLLAWLPVIDPIVNQINTIYHPSIGTLSMLQVVRCALLIVVVIIAWTTRRRARGASSTVGAIAIAIGLCVLVIAMNECRVQGEVPQASLIEYGQIAYWLTMWYVSVAWITDAASARTVITGLIIGAVIAAGSVCYAYASGNYFSVYQLAGVAASSGWFVSGKGIAGSLVTGALLSAYTGSRGRRWSSACVAFVCLAGAFLTYARSGMVALAVSLVWLLAWSIGTGSTARSSWARRLIMATLCGAIILVYTIGTADLVRRWSDIENTNAAGSGRLVLWRVSVEEFLTATATEQLFGRGVQGMVDMMYNSVGAPLSSHNDVVEMLVIGGVAGVFVVGLILAGLIIQIRSARLASPEFATAVAILLTCCCQMFFTGQLGLPDVMTFYLLGITAVLACARSRPSATVMPTAMAVRKRVHGVSRVSDKMRTGDRAGRYDLLKN